MSTSKLLQKDFEIRRDLGNRASPVKRVHVKRPILQNLGKGEGWVGIFPESYSDEFIILFHPVTSPLSEVFAHVFVFCFFSHSNLLSTHLFVGSSP